MNKYYEVRKEVLNMHISLWEKVNKKYPDTEFVAVPFLAEIGLPGGLSAKYNADEKAFFSELYKIYRAKEGI